MTEDGWLKYDKRHTNGKHDGKVGIGTSGRLSISLRFYEEMGEPRHAALYWNAQQQAIGVCVTSEDDAHGYMVQKGRNSPGLALEGFLHFHSIPHEKNARYPAHVEENGRGKMLIISLKEPEE